MCAADDVMSDKGNWGLRRTGLLALGADQCDFFYKRGGQPQPLAEQYPVKIRVASEGNFLRAGKILRLEVLPVLKKVPSE